MAARRKKKDQEQVANRGDAYEPPAAAAPRDADSALPAVNRPSSPAEDQPAETDRRPRLRRAADKLRSVIGRYFRDRRVELIDDFNAGGVGIKLTYDDPAERPSEEVKQILKAPEGNYPGLTFMGAIKQWRKRIGGDAEPRRATAIRLDAERRFGAVCEQMSHEERLRAQRQPGDGCPDERTPL
jgi:hypothetical protein